MKNTKCQESQHRNFNYSYRMFVILFALAALFPKDRLRRRRRGPLDRCLFPSLHLLHLRRLISKRHTRSFAEQLFLRCKK
jgi:hypothetical protein